MNSVIHHFGSSRSAGPFPGAAAEGEAPGDADQELAVATSEGFFGVRRENMGKNMGFTRKRYIFLFFFWISAEHQNGGFSNKR